jgi:hypothetical protein
MEYLYHRVPKNMTGTILYPLNVLKKVYPEIYAEHSKKYVGREGLLGAEIPPLKCLWNDVLHFTAVSPAETEKNFIQAGFEYKPDSYFKVPIGMIVGENSIAFTNPKGELKKVPFLDYELFDPQRMSVYQQVPQATLDYYRQKKKEGGNPLVHQFLPHILYKGSIGTIDLEIVIV